MPMVITNPTNGTAMVWQSTAFGAMRTWLDAVPNADIVDASIEREHLVRPVITPFPMQSQWSDFREHRYQDSHLDGPQTYDRVNWFTPEKVMLKPRVADRSGLVITTPIGESVDASKSRHRVWFSCSALIRMRYSDIAVQPQKVGELQIRAWQSTLATELTASAAVANVYFDLLDTSGTGNPSEEGTLMQGIELLAFFAVPINHAYVVFKRTFDKVDQIDLDRISFHVESA